MRIDNIECHILSTPFRGTKIHGQKIDLKSIAIIEVSFENISGYGEAYVGIYIPSQTKKIVEELSSYFIGKDINSIENMFNNFRIPFVTNSGIYKSILGAIEIGTYDLKAKLLGIPLYKLFSDDAFMPHLYASGGSVITDKKDLEKDLKKTLEHEIGNFKMRVGKKTWEKDIERVSYVSDNFPKMGLMVDSIAGTRIIEDSIEITLQKYKLLEHFKLIWLEEPFDVQDMASLRYLAENLDIPLAAGEAYTSLQEYSGLIYESDIDYIQFDATHSGGYLNCQKIYEKSQRNNKKTAFHVWGSLVAEMANFHLALSMENLNFFEVPLLELEINDHLTQENKSLFELVKEIPTEPGLGISITNEVIEKFKFIKGSEYRW